MSLKPEQIGSGKDQPMEPSLAFKRIAFGFKCIAGLWVILGLALLLIVLIDLCFYPLAKKKKRSHYQSAEALAVLDSSRAYRKEKKKKKRNWLPYVYWRQAETTGKYINVDREGLRKTWNKSYPATDKPMKIFMFGGSTLWGDGASDNFTIPSCLSKKLADNGIKAEVSNYGECGYVQTQEIITLMQALQAGKIPDVVIFYDGVNDAFSTFQNREAGLIQNALRFKTHKYFNADTVKPKDALVMTIKRFSRISRYMKRRKANELIQNQNWLKKEDMPRLTQDTIRVLLTNMQILKALSVQYKFKLFCFLQPNIYTKKNLRDFEKKIYDLSPNEREFTRLIYSTIAEDQRFKAFPFFYNLQTVLDDADKPIYIDFCHVNKYANEMIAQTIFKDVKTQLKASK